MPFFGAYPREGVHHPHQTGKGKASSKLVPIGDGIFVSSPWRVVELSSDPDSSQKLTNPSIQVFFVYQD